MSQCMLATDAIISIRDDIGDAVSESTDYCAWLDVWTSIDHVSHITKRVQSMLEEIPVSIERHNR